MHKETIDYELENLHFKGFLAYEEKETPRRATVIIAHTWRGVDHFVKDRAERIASLGYIGFCSDLFGEGIVAKSDEEAFSLIKPISLDRHELSRRINCAYQVIKKHPMVDPERIGAIGFCFGGLTVLELLRSGADIRGIVSFHGSIGTLPETKTVPPAPQIKGKALFLNGYEDPLVSDTDIKNLEKELTHKKVDWQFTNYGHTVHGFTNPEANSKGIHYNSLADQRSWIQMKNFFEEIFL